MKVLNEMEIDDSDYITKDVETPRNGMFQVYVDYYWWCEDGDPKKAVFYHRYSAQCNANRKVLENMKSPYDGCKIVQIPVSYIPRNLRY